MQMTFRWFGREDPVSLQHIRQIPGVTGIVTALYDVPVGEIWPKPNLAALASDIDAQGMTLAVIEKHSGA